MDGVVETGKAGWYLLHGDKPHGPFPNTAFLEAVEEGTITKDHLVWRPGWKGWRRGKAAAELLADPPNTASAWYSTKPPSPTTIEQTDEAEPEPRYEAVPVRFDALSETLEHQLEIDISHSAELPRSNYLLRHWRGELSLSKAYWINTILAVTVICSSIFALRALLEYIGPSNDLTALGAWIAFCLLVLAVVVWQFVGLWRSASYHSERGGSAFWARAAQVMVVIGASTGIVTWIADSSRFASSGILMLSTETTKVKASLIKIPAYATLQRVAPTAFNSLSEDVAERFQQGASDDAIFSAARAALGQAVKPYTPHASDEAVLEIADIYLAYMNELKETDPESCVAINDHSKGAQLRANLVKQFPNIFDRELAVNEKILPTGADASRPVPAGSQVALQLNIVQAQMTRRFDRQLALLSKQPLKPSEYQTYCQVALGLFEEIRRLPPKQAVDLLRYVYAQS